ncbi:hypothetical protein PIB30_088992, partial [Stylosanthes scabra]|nr:hypothetical protein [Stylosanthes scabra]
MANKDCNKGFADSYMLLNHEDAHFCDLLRLLFSKNVGKRKFVESHAGGDYEDSFGHRWLIFISIIGQKLLQLISKPLEWFGYLVESFINLLVLNGGFFSLIINFLKGLFIIITSF